jgi:SAM-dependent methyltransferase
MAPLNELLKPEEIRALANSFQQSRILLTAVELDIFTALEKKLMTSEQTALAIGTDPRATDRLMNALAALGLLRKVRGKFYNAENASQYLVREKPEFMGGLFHSLGLWNSWSTLTDAVRKGTSVFDRKSVQSNIDWSDAFIAAMHYRGVKEAKILAVMLDLSSVRRMLDVGGGSGTFAMEFVKKNPQMSVVVFDLPNILPITQKYINAGNMNGKIELKGGSFLTDDFGDGYDLILLSAIVHMNGYDENNMLIKKCCGALNPGGQIIIKDWVMNEERIEPAGGAFFAINMLVGTKHGDTYTEIEMREWYNNAGISKIEKKETSLGGSLVIGTKVASGGGHGAEGMEKRKVVS